MPSSSSGAYCIELNRVNSSGSAATQPVGPPLPQRPPPENKTARGKKQRSQSRRRVQGRVAPAKAAAALGGLPVITEGFHESTSSASNSSEEFQTLDSADGDESPFDFGVDGTSTAKVAEGPLVHPGVGPTRPVTNDRDRRQSECGLS